MDKLNRRSKRPKLPCIPERAEVEDEHKEEKWVPKKKHDVLKAKYKCLKKLFQVYDASVIGILPEPCGDSQTVSMREQSQVNTCARKMRSNRTITDACAGSTTDRSMGDMNVCDPAVLRDLKIQCSCSTQFCSENTHTLKDGKDNGSEASTRYADSEKGSLNPTEQNYKPDDYKQNFYCNYFNSIAPYLPTCEKLKPSRFQNFLSRIFGFKREKSCRNFAVPNGHIYAASDNDRRRRKGLRFRRMKKTKRVHSEIDVRDLRNPMLLSYVQSVQRHCLMDHTQRQCPFAGCSSILYGIINYNDHLNLSHFPRNKHICHYCHEGFHTEYDKFVHENEHLGISRLHNAHIISATSTGSSIKKVEVTQTDPEPKSEIPEEKLKKIVSFFDKIVGTDHMVNEFKKAKLCCESLHGIPSSKATSERSSNSYNRTVSCGNLVRRHPDRSKMTMSSDMSMSPIKCRICGENFDYRRQLSLHMDLEHRAHDKFSKFHSCAGLSSYHPQIRTNMATAPGNINIQTIKLMPHDLTGSSTSSSYTESDSKDETISLDLSSNTLCQCQTSADVTNTPDWSNCNKNSNFKVKNKLSGYKWEPGTQIIRV